MSQLTDSMLKAIMPLSSASNRKKALPYLNSTAIHYKITTPERLRMWLSALAVESGELKYQQEIASGSAYEGRADLGNTQPGDGRKFKGHGRIQITGRANHKEYSDYLKKDAHLPPVDFIKNPDKLAEEPYATDSAGWFVSVHKNLNRFADSGNLLAYHVGINGKNKKTGKPNGWSERQKYYNRAKSVIDDDFVLDEGETEHVEINSENSEEGKNDSNSQPVIIDTPVDSSAGTEVKQTQTVSTENGEVSQTITQSNEQDVNTPAVVQEAKLYEGVGFIPTIKKDFAAVTGGNLTFQGLQEYFNNASGWPPWIIAVITKLAIVILVISVLWLAFRLIHYLVFKWSENHRLTTEMDVKTDVKRKDVEYVSNPGNRS